MYDDHLVIPPRPPLPRVPDRRGQRLPRLARRPGAWLAAYGVLLAGIAFWPVPVDSGARPLLRAIHEIAPLLTYARIEFSANILLFVPLGALLALIFRVERWLVLPIAFLTTVTIETGQAVALAARTPSVLDIIANTAGACAGMVTVAFAELLARSRSTIDDR